MIITTSAKPSSKTVQLARNLSNMYQIPFKERLGVSVKTIKDMYHDDVVIVGSDRITVSPLGKENEVFFHPNLSLIRAKRLWRGEEDPFVTTGKLRTGMTLLDCTLGLASDSIVASLVVGPSGSVTGIEGNDILYFIAHSGLSTFQSGYEAYDEAMRRINIIHDDHLSVLRAAETRSYDVVYLDPMFQEEIDSNGINIIKEQAIRSTITEEVILEAKRVARERVLLKDHWKSNRFQQFGFKQFKRKTSLFHYGTIELN